MQADLVPVLRKGALFIRMQQRRDRGDEEGRLDLVAVQHLPNAGMPRRAPNSPQLRRATELPPSRSSLVS